MTVPANLLSKARKPGNPYLVLENEASGWRYEVLKSWQKDNSKSGARWLCAVSSPMTYGGQDIGDCYVIDAIRFNNLTYWDREVFPTKEDAFLYLERSGAVRAAPSPMDALGW